MKWSLGEKNNLPEINLEACKKQIRKKKKKYSDFIGSFTWWKLRKNATCCSGRILWVVSYNTPVVWKPASHLNKDDQDMLVTARRSKNKLISDVLLDIYIRVLADK